jgi:hypothetical protein
MKKLLSIIFVGLLLCTSSYSHDEKRFIFLNCKGDFPPGHSSNEALIKIDLKKSKIIFSNGYEYITKRKKGWEEEANFDSYGGFRTDGGLEAIDHEEYFNIDRFTGEGFFMFGKTKKSNWELIKGSFRVKCTKVERAF